MEPAETGSKPLSLTEYIVRKLYRFNLRHLTRLRIKQRLSDWSCSDFFRGRCRRIGSVSGRVVWVADPTARGPFRQSWEVEWVPF